ncbi:hypothetical protein SAMN04487995_4882 [Dyadobacter koreensis]|uniref:SnoaL-like domain-containing protein n=1 Tax=Dyadobacter koreensis TaxID=408657 RepID=A0A1H6ZFG7_9BACT|nr:hypothetical protein [Dyadobacter koreensis]SEJ47605.1 hypothetical protein SAMN04487995_4882 [Dyadobacter koreensis]
MKAISLVLIGSLFCFGCSKDPKEDEAAKAANLENEKKAINATIEKETQSFFARDYEAWKSNYAQTDYAFQAWSNDDGTFDSNVGWTDINKQIGRYISENPEPLSSHPKVERKNMMYKFYGDNVAYLTWDQFNSDKPEKNFHHSKEVRLMEKIDGQWKIVCVSAFWDYKNLIPASRLPMIQKIANESRGKNKI